MVDGHDDIEGARAFYQAGTMSINAVRPHSEDYLNPIGGDGDDEGVSSAVPEAGTGAGGAEEVGDAEAPGAQIHAPEEEEVYPPQLKVEVVEDTGTVGGSRSS